ncbi:MAG: N-acetylneuraminate synthase [Candidatus Marinimicrobia bacterium]|nr:N-acetylneuraminate synthase [Candidatus Neomarinimicrobiota bacterium]|tara:strand:- start:4930 stop:5772 length:843 start_codon:yes stop_codon:yes gene_type:complete
MKNNIYIIAEIGINHNGDLKIAKKLIDIAKVAGCDVVKFQKRNPDVCVPEHQKSIMRDTPWGRMSYLDYKYKVEFGQKEYDEIDNYCKQNEIKWTASPWDLDSLNFLNQYSDLPFIKIPSALLTDLDLIKQTTKTGKKIIISTGMSTIEEVDAAVNIIKETKPDASFAVLHCNSTYPAPNDELNLNCIETLKNRYNCEVGYSGHEFGLTTTIASICLGATIIERHITIDRTMWGTDQMCSVEPQGLIKLVRGINELQAALGNGEKVVTETEKPIRKKLRK